MEMVLRQPQHAGIDARRVTAITGVLVLHLLVAGALLLPRQPAELTPRPAIETDVVFVPIDEVAPPPIPPPPPPVNIQPVAPPVATTPVAPLPAPAPLSSAPQVVVDTPSSEPATLPSTSEIPATGVMPSAPAGLVTLQTLRSPSPPYPRRALAREIEGTTMLRVLVGADGLPQTIEVERSSGNRDLDLAAVRGLKRWTFKPYRMDGQARPVWARVPVQFKIDSNRR